MLPVEVLLLIPLVVAIVLYVLREQRQIETVAVIGSLLELVATIWLAYEVFANGEISYGFWYLDGLSAFMLVLIGTVGTLVCLYSIGYLRHDVEEHEVQRSRLRFYYLLLHLFLLTMQLVVISNNLGLMWIAIEATTLASAFLVGFYEKETAIEAAWKYIIICSVGIALALFGTVLTYASSINVLGESSDALNWTTLREIAPSLDPTFLRMAFIFILVGYGTKVGLAPMHTWLPDAHSQSPSPISALLSGVLLNCALYGVLRFYIITELSVPGFAPGLMLLFGLLSIVLAACFIIVAKDFKRLLAYSSIEHMGVACLGFGLGGTLGILGGLLHMLNHTLTKVMLFFGAGNILQKYRTRTITEVKGLATVMPITAAFFLLGALAITGSPPFSVFLSELLVLQAGLSSGQYLVSALYLLGLGAVFAGFMYHVIRMVFGEPTEGVAKGEGGLASLGIMTTLVVSLLIIGIFLPEPLMDLLSTIATLFPGGSP